GGKYLVLITDTAGSRSYPDLLEDSIRSGDGFIIVFALDDVKSFKEAIEIQQEILSTKGGKCPVVLVGNKTDLVNERQVFPPMIKEVVNQCFRTSIYIETSAKLKKKHNNPSSERKPQNKRENNRIMLCLLRALVEQTAEIYSHCPN
ncbi:hypothetical protein NPIL_546281, partial [Nephila pilipes]